MGCCPMRAQSKKNNDSNTDATEQNREIVDDVIPEIEDTVSRLKKLDSYTKHEATEQLEILASLASLSHDLREKYAAFLASIGYGELYIKIIKSFQDHGRFRQQDKEGINNLMITQRAFFNFTHVCPALGRDLGQYGGVELLLNDIDVLEEFLNQRQVLEYIDKVLGILYNAIHLYTKNRFIYRKARAVQILTKLLKVENMTIKIKTLLVLAHCVDEEESAVLATAHGCVKLLTQMLGEAVKTTDHVASIGICRFYVNEILDGLNRLAINDENKSEILKEGGIVSILRLLQSNCNEEEQKLAAEALWNLSFVEKIRRNTQIAECTPVLEELTTSKNEELREASTYALWEIKDGDKELLSTPTKCSEVHVPKETCLPRGQHVMISYQWDSQNLALMIKDNLKNAGLSVWMDVDKMKGNLLHAMAEAIESSAVVVVCMSQRYKESLNCRSEASYAYKKKPITAILIEEGYEPDGWLGLLLGMQLYYQAFSSATLKKSMPSIISEIREKTYGEEDAIEGIADVSRQESQSHPIPQVSLQETNEQNSQSSKDSDAQNWSTQRVQEWLNENGLEDLCSILEFCDGKHLLDMYNRFKESPETFRNDLKSDLNLSFITSVKFTTALEKISN